MDQDNTLGTLSRVANPGVQPVAQSGESNIANKADPFVSTSVLAQGRVSQKVKGRDRRVDFFRGLALLMIFIDHVPGNMLSSFMLWNFGLCDAAEVFVLLAGISASLAFGALYERTSWRAATARVLMRCWDLYVVHIVLFCIVAAVVVSATRYFDNPFYLEQVNLLPLFADTERALVYALTLGYQPDFLDILPLYCVLLAFVPVSVPICILKPWVVLVPSGALYLLIQFWPFNLPNYPGETGWYFNPFAWQFLFVIGLVIGTARRRDWVVDHALRRVLLIASMVYIAAALIVAAPWRQIPWLEQVVVIPWSWLPPLSKTNLSTLRLLDILALACLVTLAMRPENRLVLGAFGRFCGLLGSHSLPVFAVGIVASTLGNVWFMEVGRGLVSHVIVNASGFGAMFGAAWLASWLKGRPWEVKRNLAAPSARAQEHRIPDLGRAPIILVPVFAMLPLGASHTFAAPPAEEKCMAPAEYVQFDVALPNARASMTDRGILTIVALGSSTTQGAGSSKPGSDYPSRLQDELARRFPNIEIRVLNRGIGGQTARDMLDRVYADVLGDHPSLTIWQTGVNDALEEVPIEEFKDTLRQGIDVLHDSDVDVILMDMQYYPTSERVPDYDDYLKAMREVADEKRVSLFRRYDIMKYWVHSGQFRVDEMLFRDQFHMADPSYRCLGSELADALEAELD